MNLIQIIKENNSSLKYAARQMGIFSLDLTFGRCRKTIGPQEPDFVATLVIEGRKFLEERWRPIFNQYNIRLNITSVFCHGRPQVKFKKNGNETSCELGDILLIHLHRYKNGDALYNALLYQVKMVQQLPYNVENTNMDQLYLYSKWPEYEYINSTILNGRKRIIRPSMPSSAAQYLTINKSLFEFRPFYMMKFKKDYPIQSCIPNLNLIGHNDFGKELIEFISLRSGRPFDRKGNTDKDDGWSNMIWDMVAYAGQKAFNRKNSGRKDQLRLRGVNPIKLDGSLSFTHDHNSDIFREGLDEEKYYFLFHKEEYVTKQSEYFTKDDEPHGVSVMTFETFEGM